MTRYIALLVVLASASACGASFEGDEPGECSDGADNDRNGEFDCDDAGCKNAPSCQSTDPGSGTGTGTGTGTGGGTGTGTGTPSTGTPTGTVSLPADCKTAEVGVFPPDTSTNAFYLTHVEATLSELASGTESIEVSDGGSTIPGATMTDGTIVTWEPNSPLDPSTTYDITLDWRCGPTGWSFTTTSTGSPVPTGGLPERTYSLDLSAGRVVHPAGAGSLFSFLISTELLVGVVSSDATSIGLLTAPDVGSGDQDLCTETTSFGGDFTGNPYFWASTSAQPANLAGLVLQDPLISGSFNPTYDQIEGAVVEGSLDLLDASTCSLLAAFGLACGPCPATGNSTCVDLEIDSLIGTEIAGLTLALRNTTDIECDPSCGSYTTDNPCQ